MAGWRHFLIVVSSASSLALACFQPGHASEADPPPLETVADELLSETPRINTLLIEREFALIGGRWGSDLFIDAPLNGEPEGAQVTLRRAKLWYARALGKHWSFKLSGDYTRGGGLEFSSNYLRYAGWDRTLLTLGITDPPFSQESVSDSGSLTFMETGLPVAALAERKSGGIAVLRRNPGSILNAAVILFNVGQDDLREEGQGVVMHYVHSPIEIGHQKSIHVGGSISYRWNATDEGSRFRTRPEVATVNDYFVDTGEIAGADRIGRVSIEASQVAGRFSWQTEWLAARVERDDDTPVFFWGAYANLSWFLTKDSRNYNFGLGQFENVKVQSPLLQGGRGAFELAFRASCVDLSDKDVFGGSEINLSAGINWYLNDRIRLMTNLVKVVDVNRPGSEFDGQDPLIISLRAQWVLN